MEDLKRKRKVLKTSITRLDTQIQELLNVADTQKEEYESRLCRLEELFKNFNVIQEEIESSIIEEKDFEDESTYRDTIERKYFGIKSKLLNTLRQAGNEQIPQTHTHQQDNITAVLESLTQNQAHLTSLVHNLRPNPITTSTPVNTTTIESQVKIPLPVMQIPIFEGDYKEWQSFHDMFNTMVNNNSSLSAVQKLQYLKSTLKGEAASSLRHLSITEANYEKAFKLLKDKYDKKDYIIDSHLRTITSLPALKIVSAQGLRMLINTFSETINALEALELPTDKWDTWLNFLLLSKLDPESEQLWRREISHKENMNNFPEFMRFLNKRVYELTSISQTPKDIKQGSQFTSNQHKVKHSHTTSVTKPDCIVCKSNHYIYSCPSFASMKVDERRKLVSSKGLCYNCLKGQHFVKNCQTQGRCRNCGKKHHTLLHEAVSQTPQNHNDASNNSTTQSTSHACSLYQRSKIHVSVLPTIVVYIKDSTHQLQPCRALLDTGSQLTLISENCIQRLRLRRENGRISLAGIGNVKSKKNFTRGKVCIDLFSKDERNAISSTAYILTKLTHDLPSTQINANIKNWFINKCELSDPSFDSPSKIDIIVGCDIAFDMLLQEKISYEHDNRICAYKTIFGWVICGKVEEDTSPTSCMLVLDDIDKSLRRFWEIEEITSPPQLSREEKECEQHFIDTHERLNTGEYMVRLPFKTNVIGLGNTRENALRRLHHMEKKFQRDQELSQCYDDFMSEYESLGHMEKTSQENTSINESATYFLPHHGVWKRSSNSTKLRVVFDGSSSSSNGLSLNELLHTGFKVHNELTDILTRFRISRIAYVADIQKMYRQIIVHPEDRKFQMVVWRKAIDHPVNNYELKTVTYGTSCAPFLALRTLRQLAVDEYDAHPRGARLIQHNFYVDDLMNSDDNIQEASINVKEITDILQKGHFTLHKWASNCPELLEEIPQNLQECTKAFETEGEAIVKTLGLNWHSRRDELSFKVEITKTNTTTKRGILSIISRIYDPLGLLSPCILFAKLYMQKMWIMKQNWDEPVTGDLEKQWNEISAQLPGLEQIRIPRWLYTNKTSYIQLHGFSDASEKAYAAVIYLRVRHEEHIKVNIIAAKTKIAPIRQLSIPRLELCAAQLLTKLFLQIKNALSFDDKQLTIYAWTDSKTVLAWLDDVPRRWSTFVGNRTSMILDVLPRNRWNHVKSGENPADLATRGILPSEISDCKLWWHGPLFLHDNQIEIKSQLDLYSTDEEKRKVCLTTASVSHQPSEDLINRYSNFSTLIRITAWCIKFTNKCRKIKTEGQSVSTSFLTIEELRKALQIHIINEQQTSFFEEFSRLQRNAPMKKESKLWSLEPFIDKDGIVRVGGRIHNAQVTYEQRHPTILHKNSVLSKLIVKHYHLKYLHASGQQLESNLRLKYWIIGIKQLIKTIVRECITCLRYNSKTCLQKMSTLPSCRIQPVDKAFSNCGVDFAGPITALSWKGRGAKQIKCYISLFICMSTKAIHLELVMDLSSESFLAALKRFISRRGKILTMYSDNGTNFHGAVKQLNDVYQYFKDKRHRETIYNFFIENEIMWKFIPPHAPNFGGLWEAGVKRVKYHLKRIIGSSHFTYDELNTLLCQIESILNTRPLIPLSDNKDDLEVLTPNHLLLGGDAMQIPELPIDDKIQYFRSRWRHLQKVKQDFWKAWQKDYLSTLQQRHKWTKKRCNLKINDIVIISDDNTPPGNWLLGKVEQVHPGSDDLVRVVTVRTKNGLLKRPISKLIYLYAANEAQPNNI